MSNTNILLVEGEADRGFFEALCRMLSISADVRVEDWIKQCLNPAEANLYQHGENSIDAIPGGPKFQPWNRTKAEVATWLAWQKKPEHGLYNAAQSDFLNTAEPLFKSLQMWLTHVFAP